MEAMVSPFTLTVDWLAFTVPDAEVQQVITLVEGDWILTGEGFRGYRKVWTSNNGTEGKGFLGTWALRQPKEVHVDLSAGIVSTWSTAKVRAILQWIFEHAGHMTRIDCALDDRAVVVNLEQIQEAVRAGQCLTRAKQLRDVSGSSIDTGTTTGRTLYFGSPASRTLLRVYDKRLEMQHKGRGNWRDYGVRWELELKHERAQACGHLLSTLQEEEWGRCVTSLLRGFIDFRETTRDEDSSLRCRAPLVGWWAQLTDGLEKCRLHVEKEVRSLEDMQRWAVRSLAPTLAVLKEGAGAEWFQELLEEGERRWRPHHRRLLKGKPPKRTYGLMPLNTGKVS